QPRRPANLVHHGVAGVDAEAALNASELCAIPNVDAGWADSHTLIAIDAIASLLTERTQVYCLLDRTARLAAVVFIGDVERPFVGQRGLNARPWAHVETDLLPRMAGQKIGRCRENADPDIGERGSLEGGEILYQCRRIGKIENPGAARPPGYH